MRVRRGGRGPAAVTSGKIWRCLTAVPVVLVLAWPAVAADGYELSARADPAFRIAVTINGAVVATVRPARGGPASVTARIGPDQIHSGDNELSVIYNVVADTRDESAPAAFVVRLGSMGARSGGADTPLVEVLGPKPPFPHRGAGGRITRQFAVKP